MIYDCVKANPGSAFFGVACKSHWMNVVPQHSSDIFLNRGWESSQSFKCPWSSSTKEPPPQHMTGVALMSQFFILTVWIVIKWLIYLLKIFSYLMYCRACVTFVNYTIFAINKISLTETLYYSFQWSCTSVLHLFHKKNYCCHNQ